MSYLQQSLSINRFVWMHIRHVENYLMHTSLQRSPKHIYIYNIYIYIQYIYIQYIYIHIAWLAQELWSHGNPVVVSVNITSSYPPLIMAPPGLGTLGQPHSKKTLEFRGHERESWLQLAWKKLNLVIVEQLDEEHDEEEEDEEEDEEEERRRRRIDNDREGLVASTGK